MRNVLIFIISILVILFKPSYAQTFSGESNTFEIDTEDPVIILGHPNEGYFLKGSSVQITYNHNEANFGPTPLSFGLSTEEDGLPNYFAENESTDNGYYNYSIPWDITTNYAKFWIKAVDEFGNSSVDKSENYITISDEYAWRSRPDHLQGGIAIEIIETKDNSHSNVKFVGYDCMDNNGDIITVDTFSVNDEGYAFIGTFPDGCVEQFRNEIKLFDQFSNLIGHIGFKYDPIIESNRSRQAIIFFHNDNDMCGGGWFFPYDPQTNPYNPTNVTGDWDYFQEGEYPVSMLIPPNNTIPLSGEISGDNFQLLLLVHGVEGTYSWYPKVKNYCKYSNNVSYWYKTPNYLNTDKNQSGHKNFHAWQIYYPNDSDQYHNALCLKFLFQHLFNLYNPDCINNPSCTIEKKIGIVAHSMGSLVTIKYLINNSSYISKRVEKVLIFTPPIHGSWGSNRHYNHNEFQYFKHELLLEITGGIDSEAPCYMDMSQSSLFFWDLHSLDWNSRLDLNDNGIINDDYFVFIGLTEKKYTVWYKDLLVHHNEANNHNDFIVAYSSASLLDHYISCAGFYGNHDDGRSSFSYLNDDKFGFRVIKDYFTYDNSSFLNVINDVVKYPEIEVIINGENKDVIKPAGQNISNISTSHFDTDFQRGIYNFQLLGQNPFKEYYTYYNSQINMLKLFIEEQPLLLNKELKDYDYIGSYRKNFFTLNHPIYNSTDRHCYYFHNTFFGCALDIDEGLNYIEIKKDNNKDNKYTGSFYFNYLETLYDTIGDVSPSDLRVITNNQTDTKIKSIIVNNSSPNDSLKTHFNIDDQTSTLDYSVKCFESDYYSLPIDLFFQLPNGTVVDTSYSGGTWTHDTIFEERHMIIQNPLPGRWHLWVESDSIMADTMDFISTAYLYSDVYSYLLSDSNIFANNDTVSFQIGLIADTLSLFDSLEVQATVFILGDTILSTNITSTLVTADSCYLFSNEYFIDSIENHLIKYNIKGKYDEFWFERALYQRFLVFDPSARLNLSEIELTANNRSIDIDLIEYSYSYNCDYDSIFFSDTLISFNIDTSTISYSIIDSTQILKIYTNLSDTGNICLDVFMLLADSLLAHDTIKVKVGLPDLKPINLTSNKSSIHVDSVFSISYEIKNQGNTSASSNYIKYYCSSDTIFNDNDIFLDSLRINLLEQDSTFVVNNDTICLPKCISAGGWYLLVYADADDYLLEYNDTNNVIYKPVNISSSYSIPVINLGSDTTICTGYQVQLDPGQAYLKYQWSNGSFSQIQNVYYPDTLSIVVQDTNLCWSLADTIILYEPPPPVITTQPTAQSVKEGDTINFSITGSGDYLEYQWLFESDSIQGANDSNLIIPFAFMSDEGNYSCIVCNCSGSITSTDAYVTVLDSLFNNLIIPSHTVDSGQDECFDAADTVIVGGDGRTFIVESGGSATIIAGEAIFLRPGVHCEGYFHAYITNTNDFCDFGSDRPEFINIEDFTNYIDDISWIKVYPNPTSKLLNIDIQTDIEVFPSHIILYDFMGRILIDKIYYNKSFTIDLSDFKSGIYILKVTHGKKLGVFKVIKQF